MQSVKSTHFQNNKRQQPTATAKKIGTQNVQKNVHNKTQHIDDMYIHVLIVTRLSVSKHQLHKDKNLSNK